MKRKFFLIIALVLCSIFALLGQAFATTYNFEYDNNVSVGRNKAANYAYEILNYYWDSDRGVFRYQGQKTQPKTTSGRIYGIPYTYSNWNETGDDSELNHLVSFATYKNLTIAQKQERANYYEMEYGMVCATLVTDCIRQGFPSSENLPLLHGIYFNSSNSSWSKYITQGTKSIEGYKELRRGDYLLQYGKHVILVIDNNYKEEDPDNSSIKYIHQTSAYYINDSDRVGTDIGSYSYSNLSSKGYYPMYVNYPDDDDPTPSGIKINAENFPDDLFREYVSYWDKDGNGYFSDSEIEEITDFGWHGGPHPDNVNPNAWSGWPGPQGVLINNGSKWAGIKSIEGIKYFKNLESLYVYNDNISTIDVSGMTKLGDLRCYNNKITNLNVSGCTALWRLECQNNQVSTLNLSGCSALKYIDASNNPITNWNITNCTKLEEIIVKGTNFRKLNISGLRTLKKLDVTWCENLTELFCYENSLTSLTIQSCESLKTLYCNDNKLTELNIAFCPAMTEVNCKNNNLSLIFFAGGNSVINNMVNLERDSNVIVKVNSQIATAPTITTISMPNATVGQPYRATIQATGTGTIRYKGNAETVTNGFLFDGEKLYCTTGIINGTPKYEKASFSFPVTAENFMGYTTKKFPIKISSAATPPKITEPLDPLCATGRYFTKTYTATGSTPITWKLEGSLPPGLSFNKSTATISGTPTPTEEGKNQQTSKKYSFTVTASNSAGSDSLKDTIGVWYTPEFTTKNLANATQGEPYEQILEVTGTWATMGWQLKNGSSLPPGLELKTCSEGTMQYWYQHRKISGTPTVAGTYKFTIQVHNCVGLLSGEKEFTLVVNPPAATKPKIESKIQPFCATGEYFKRTFTATGTTPITWNLSGSLPPGLSFNKSTATISGTPTSTENGKNSNAPIVYKFTVTASNSAGTDSLVDSISVWEPPVLRSYGIQTPYVGEYYENRISVTGTYGDMNWSISGSLPKGLKFENCSGTFQYSKQNAHIFGTAQEAGTFPIVIKITNAGGLLSTKLSFNLVFKNKNEKPVIKTSAGALTSGAVGNSYSYTLEATGTTPITWEIYSGKFPDGLSLGSSTGKISGTPSKSGTYNFSICAKNSVGYSEPKDFSITITEKPTIITNSPLSKAIIGKKYSAQLEATGDTPMEWSISSNLKMFTNAGFSINSSTGSITGIPSKGYTANGEEVTSYYTEFTVKATNKWGSTTKDFRINIEKNATATKPVFITSEVPNGEIGVAYNLRFEAESDTEITWSLSGTLPKGLNFDKSTGVISGVSTQNGTYKFTITAKNKAGIASALFSLTITGENPVKPQIITSKLNATTGKSFSETLEVTGTNPITWTLMSSKLPESVNFDENTATLSGTPNKAGSFSFKVKAENLLGNVTKSITLTVKDEMPNILTSEIPNGEIGVAYNLRFEVEKDTGITWSLSGTLPKGLKFDKSTAVISGVPIKNGNYKITVKAKNKSGTTSKAFTLSITGENPVKPKITTSKLPNGTNGHLYTASIEATGSNPITWDLISNNFPEDSNFKFDETSGTITVTPTKAGNFSLKVKATNLLGSVTKSLKITVKEEIPVITTSELPDGTVKNNYDFDLEASGTGKIQWSKSGNFPKGLKLSNTGKISGIPTKAGTYKFKIKAKNSAGTATSDFQIVIVDNKDNKSDFKKGSEKSLLEENISLINSEKIDNDKSEIEQSNSGNQPKLTKLFVLSNDEFVEVQEFTAQPNQEIIFKIGDWVNSNGETIEVSDIKLRVITDESEFLDTPEISDEGIFVVPEELVEGELIISLKALSGDINIESESVLVNSDE